MTWCSVAPPDRTPAPSSAALTPRQLDELRQLGAIGYVRGIHARLDLLEQGSPDAAAYVAHLRVLVSEFRMDEFMTALDAATLCATPERADPPGEPAGARDVPGGAVGETGSAPVQQGRPA